MLFIIFIVVFVIQTLIKYGASANINDKKGQTALHIMATKGQIEYVNLI
jgi:ankyrin repeat protein